MKYIVLLLILSFWHINARNFTNYTIPYGILEGDNPDPYFQPYWKNECVLVNNGMECHYKKDDFPFQFNQHFHIPLKENTFWVSPMYQGFEIMDGGMYTGKLKGSRIILLMMPEANHDYASWWLDDAEDRIISSYSPRGFDD